MGELAFYLPQPVRDAAREKAIAEGLELGEAIRGFLYEFCELEPPVIRGRGRRCSARLPEGVDVGEVIEAVREAHHDNL